MKRRTAALLLTLSCRAFSQQVADPNFKTVIEHPAYPQGSGPAIFIDEAHNNYHTMDGRYHAFADLLRKDGYVVKPFTSQFRKTALKPVDILVISNALHARNIGNWTLPTPSAFTEAEIAAVRGWVEDGGGLFLIADHMPFPGAAADLARTFGFEFNNGFAIDTTRPKIDVFARTAGTLTSTAITAGRNSSEVVDSVATFTGQAFLGPEPAQPLLILNSHFVSLMPERAWQFNTATPSKNVGGWLQGAIMNFGKGRVAVFGEAAMFTAQVSDANQNKMGMNHPHAPQNWQFLLNVIHWLDGLLE